MSFCLFVLLVHEKHSKIFFCYADLPFQQVNYNYELFIYVFLPFLSSVLVLGISVPTVKPHPEAHMDMILFEVCLKNIHLILQDQRVQ